MVNALVGGMIGLERTILPELAGKVFGLEAHATMLSFIVVFGVTKALTNYYTGSLANRVGRKKLLVAGWVIGFPIPFLLMYAPSWSWIVGANVLLGINQGLTWSSTVVMKIDLVGEKNRGLAMGLNEASGYMAVALSAFATGWVASHTWAHKAGSGYQLAAAAQTALLGNHLEKCQPGFGHAGWARQ
jgi:MFS family permease